MINSNEDVLLMVSIFLFIFFVCAESLASEPSCHFSIVIKGYIEDHKDLWQVRLDESPFRPALPENRFLISEVRRVIIGSGVSTSSTRDRILGMCDNYRMRKYHSVFF